MITKACPLGFVFFFRSFLKLFCELTSSASSENAYVCTARKQCKDGH